MTSGMIIGDPVQFPNGSADGLPSLPKVGVNPISAAIYLPTLYGALTISSMTTAQRDALTPYIGMIIYNTDTTTFDAYFAGVINAWDNIGGGLDTFSRIFVGNGSAAAPSMSFTSDHSTGIYFSAGPIISFSVGGVESFALSDTGIQILAGSGIPGTAFFFNEVNSKYVALAAQTVAGGLTSNIVLTLPASTPVLNNTPLVANPGGTMFFSAANVCYATMNVTSAQLKAMYTTPVLVIPHISGTAIIVHRAAIETLTGTAYAGGGGIYLEWANIGHGTFEASDSFSDALLTGTGVTTYIGQVAGLEYPGGLSGPAVTGQDIYLTNDTAAFTTGTFDIKLYVWYSVIPVV